MQEIEIAGTRMTSEWPEVVGEQMKCLESEMATLGEGRRMCSRETDREAQPARVPAFAADDGFGGVKTERIEMCGARAGIEPGVDRTAVQAGACDLDLACELKQSFAQAM